jgi:hypothetical protein
MKFPMTIQDVHHFQVIAGIYCLDLGTQLLAGVLPFPIVFLEGPSSIPWQGGITLAKCLILSTNAIVYNYSLLKDYS